MEQPPCPACGFRTMNLQYGTFFTCPVCGWVDDAVQLANPTVGNGANQLSLALYQLQAMITYPQVVEIAKGYRRAKSWRPLTEKEINNYKNLVKAEGSDWSNGAVYLENFAYWNK